LDTFGSASDFPPKVVDQSRALSGSTFVAVLRTVKNGTWTASYRCLPIDPSLGCDFVN